MFSFLGELLCLVSWLIGRGHEVLRRVCSVVLALLETDRVALRGRVNSCDASWLARVARWWEGFPLGDRLLANRLLWTRAAAWPSSASLATVPLPSQFTRRN